MVESVELDDWRPVRVRAVLGEEVFRTIAHDNPREFLGEA